MANTDQIRGIGCCGAYCATCRAYIDGACKGCKLGYDTKERDINKARCKMKVCCLKEKKLETCADCREVESCIIIRGFYAKNGYKYEKYRESIEYIRANGYAKFLEKAKDWKGAYGKFG